MARDVTTTGRGHVWVGEPPPTQGERPLSILLISQRALSDMTLTADVEQMPSAEGAVARLRSRAFDCVVLDQELSEQGGLELLRELRRLGLDVPVVMLTGSSDDRLDATIGTAVRLHRAERALKASQTWASTALRSISDAVITTDARGSITFLNRAAEELTGWTSASAVGHLLGDVADVIPDSDGLPLEIGRASCRERV